MPPTSAAMELKVLISILTQGQALPNLLAQTKQLSAELTKLQSQANAAGASTGFGNVTAGAKKAAEAVHGMGGAGTAAAAGILSLEQAVNKAVTAIKFLAGGFLALQSVRFIKDLADTAARAEVLSTVLHVVGNNAGYSVEQLDKADRAVQSMGITAAASRQSLTQFIQAQLDLTKAPELARAAQDAAVILGTNSSVAFERLVTSVQTSNTLMLRHMGIVVQAEAAYSKYAQSIGKTSTQLTTLERTQAFLNATLEQTRRIAGSYTAAMGDVGKQIQSLDRFIENLKESLGRQLLPAYLAIVEELTLFLQHMGLTADEMYGQGEGAKKLGQDIRSLARAIREFVEFAVEHRTVIARIVEAWLLLRYVINPVIGLIGRLQAALAAPAAGGIMARLITGLGGLAGGIITLGAALIYLELKFDKFNAAIGTIVGAVWTAILAIGTFLQSLAKGTEAFLKTIAGVIVNPFSGDSWKKPWQEWSTFVSKEIQKVKEMWENTKARFSQIFVTPGEEIPDNRQALQEQHQKSLEEEAALMTEIMAKTREYNDLIANPAATEAKITNTRKELGALKEKQRGLEEVRKSQQEELKYSDAMRQMEAKRLEEVAKEKDKQKVQDLIDEARKGAKFTYTPEGGELGQQFAQQLAQFSNLLQVYSLDATHAGLSTAELVRNLRDAGGATKTRTELERLVLAAKDLTKVSPKSAVAAAEIVAQARIQVEQARIQETAASESRRQADFRNQEKRLSDHFDQELNDLKARNSQQEALEQEAYSRGALSFNAYYDQRLARLKEENQKEMDAAVFNITSIEKEQAGGFAKTKQEKDALETRRLEAVAKRESLVIKNVGAETAEDIRRRNERLSLDRKILDIQLEMAASHGSEVDAIASINENYKRQAEQLHLVTGSQEEAILNAAKQIEIDAVHVQFLDRALSLDTERLRVEQQAITVEQSRLNVTKQRTDADLAAGRITNVQAMRIKNEQTLRQIELDRQTLLLKEADLERKKAYEAERYLDIVRQQKTLGFGEFSAETRTRVLKDLGDVRKEIEALALANEEMAAGIDLAFEKLLSYGKQLREVFRDSLTQMLTDLATRTGKIEDILKTFLKNLERQIAKSFFENIATRITNSIIEATSTKDEKGKAIPGTSIFENIFKALGLGTEVLGSSPTKPMFVSVTNPGAFGGGGGTGIGSQNLLGGLGFGSNVASRLTGVDWGPVASLINKWVSLSKLPRIQPFGLGIGFAGGGPVSGPGTGTSDSVPAMVSAGEHIMPASKAAQWMPLLEGIRLGTILPAYALGGVVALQSIAIPSVLPRYASGGTVVTDAGASAVQPAGGVGNMMVSLHPDALNMTMREWLEHEVVRQQGRR